MANNNNLNYITSRKERATYFLFYLGQNILWGYAGYVETFLTDIGIAAGTAAMVLLFPKLWDAINDVLFGYIVDRHTFKNGQKFLPWVKIGSAAVGITTVVLFAIPASLPQAVLGGCTIMMFGQILLSGMQMIAACGFSQRNITIASLSLAVGVGFTAASEQEIWAIFPKIVQDVFSGNVVAVVFVVAMILSYALPENMEVTH